jgi:hypothetical protein
MHDILIDNLYNQNLRFNFDKPFMPNSLIVV